MISVKPIIPDARLWEWDLPEAYETIKDGDKLLVKKGVHAGTLFVVLHKVRDGRHRYVYANRIKT